MANAAPSNNNVTPRDTIIGGSLVITYIKPDTHPRIIPDNIDMASITIAGNPALIHIVALITDDNKDIAPIEKSNLPEFKLIDNAKVVSITVAVARKNAIQLPLDSKSAIPLRWHIVHVIIKASNGITIVPVILFPILILLFFIYNPFLCNRLPFPAAELNHYITLR